MNVFISHQSALEFWTSPVHCDGHTIKSTNSRALPGKPCTAGEAEHLLQTTLLGLSAPLHICVSSRSGRRNTDSHHKHFSKAETLPQRSFWQLEKNLYVASPELCFLQASQLLSPIEHIKFGFELCGDYVLDETDLRGFRKRKPLTTPSRLRMFISRSGAIPGKAQATRVAQYILGNSASPLETAAAMLISVPRKLGGYGLPAPQLNSIIYGSQSTRFIKEARYRKPDLCWPSKRLIVECDSILAHSSQADIARDSKRRAELIHEGYEVITLTFSEMASPIAFNNFIQNIARKIGYKLRPSYLTLSAERIELRNLVLPPTSNHQ